MKDAREKDESITKEDVEEFLGKMLKKSAKPRGENSFVAPHAHFEYQVDLFFISNKDLERQELE